MIITKEYSLATLATLLSQAFNAPVTVDEVRPHTSTR